MNDEFFQDHYTKTAKTYFVVERFLSLTPKGVKLSPLTRLALMLMLEPECSMSLDRLAMKMRNPARQTVCQPHELREYK